MTIDTARVINKTTNFTCIVVSTVVKKYFFPAQTSAPRRIKSTAFTNKCSGLISLIMRLPAHERAFSKNHAAKVTTRAIALQIISARATLGKNSEKGECNLNPSQRENASPMRYRQKITKTTRNKSLNATLLFCIFF
jgi:hypothetical protein